MENKKISKLLENKEFMEKLVENFESEGNIKELFEKYNILITNKEINELKEQMVKITNFLSNIEEKELNKIAGGACSVDYSSKSIFEGCKPHPKCGPNANLVGNTCQIVKNISGKKIPKPIVNYGIEALAFSEGAIALFAAQKLYKKIKGKK